MSEMRLLQKYGGMRWTDPDSDGAGAGHGICIADAGNMEFQGGRNGAGWCLIGTNEVDGGMEPWTIDIAIDLIAEYQQPSEMNVEIILDEELRNANWDRGDSTGKKMAKIKI